MVDLAVRDQSAKVLFANNFYPSYFAVLGSQSTNVLSAKMLIGSNPPKFFTAKVLYNALVLYQINEVVGNEVVSYKIYLVDAVI